MMVALGLVIREPDTIAGVARRMTDQFESARFGSNAAHKSLPSLAEKGFLRLIAESRSGTRSLDFYEATPEGIGLFREWLRSTELPPAIRDPLQSKLEFLELEELNALIGIVRDQERACVIACESAHARVLQEQRSRSARRKPVSGRDRLRSIQTRDEANLWSMMVKRLEDLGDELEELLRETSADGAARGG